MSDINRFLENSTDEEKWLAYASAQANQSSSQGLISPDILDFLVILLDELKLDRGAILRAYARYMAGERLDA